MKPSSKSLRLAFTLACLPFGLGGCLSGPYVDDGVYYGPQRDPWFRDDAWIDDHGWPDRSRGEADIGIYLHPPRYRW